VLSQIHCPQCCKAIPALLSNNLAWQWYHYTSLLMEAAIIPMEAAPYQWKRPTVLTESSKLNKDPIRAGPRTLGFSMVCVVPEWRVARCPARSIHLKLTSNTDQDRSSNSWVLYGLSCTWVMSCCEHSSKLNKDTDQGQSSNYWLLSVPEWRVAQCPAVSSSQSSPPPWRPPPPRQWCSHGRCCKQAHNSHLRIKVAA
jgi:hypothetical protein